MAQDEAARRMNVAVGRRGADGAPAAVAAGRDVLLLVPGLLVLVAGVLLSALDGGFEPTVWYPTALFLLVLLVLTVVVAPPQRVERDRLVTIAAALFGLFCAWSYAAILWADAPGSAWEGANRVLLYGLGLGLVLLRPWTRRAATIALAIVGGGLSAVALVVLVGGAIDTDPSRLLQEGRLGEPAGYVNATAGLWLIGIWPLLALALMRSLPWPARALCLGAATLLLQAALLSQSRGGAIALVAAACVYIALSPRRWPALAALALPVAVSFATFDTLAAVRDAPTIAALAPAFDAAVEAILIGAAIATAVGALGLLAGRRAQPWLDANPAARRGGDVALLAIAALLAVGALAAIGDPVDWADDRWRDFKTSGYGDVNRSSNRFTGSLGSGRYDFYRVTLGQFEERPLLGVGQDNFANEYLQRRDGGEAPRHPHSLVLRTLAQAGLIGSALFFGAIALLLGAAWRARQRLLRVADDSTLVVGGIAAFAVWFVQAAGDWLWAFPALGILAFGLLGVAARLERPVGAPATVRRRPAAGGPGARFRLIAGRSAVAICVLAAALSLVCAGIAARYTSAAYDSSGSDIASSLARLGRAANLNPLSAEPLLAKGVLAQRIGRLGVAIAALREAAGREPENWFTHLELGLALSARGQDRRALMSLREARRLNPSQPLVDDVIVELRAGRSVDATEVERSLSRALEKRLSPVDPGAARSR